MAYELQDAMSRLGLFGLWKTVTEAPSAAGPLFPILGGISATLLGGGRLPALFVNFLGFAALQIVVFSYAKRTWGASTAWAAIGLILSQATLWLLAGGLFDFRMDFVVYCLWGIWVCAVLRSDIFLERNWALIAALVAIVVVLTRFIAVVYLGGVLAGMAAVLVAMVVVQRGPARDQSLQRLINFSLCAIVVAVAIAPVLSHHWREISKYYVVGHLTGEEKHIRAAAEGIVNWFGHFIYYPQSVVKYHLGAGFLIACAIYCAAVALSFIGRSSRASAALEAEQFPLRLVFLLGAIIAPLVILTFNISKSPLVGSIVGIPVVLLVVAVGSRLVRIGHVAEPRFFPVAGMLVLAAGLVAQLDNAVREPASPLSRRSKQQGGDLLLRLNQIAQQRDWKSVILSVDAVGPEIFHGAATAWGYEQTGILTKFRPGLGHSIFAISRDAAFKDLAISDIVVLSDLPKVSVFPFAASYATIEKDVIRWAEQHLVKIAEMRIGSHKYRIFARPKAELKGLSGEWVTNAGLGILLEGDEVKQFTSLTIEGTAPFERLPKTPAVTAKARLSDNETIDLPATLARRDARYEIVVGLPKPTGTGPIEVQLAFDTFFVPKELGINDDQRRLVVMKPDRINLR